MSGIFKKYSKLNSKSEVDLKRAVTMALGTTKSINSAIGYDRKTRWKENQTEGGILENLSTIQQSFHKAVSKEMNDSQKEELAKRLQEDEDGSYMASFKKNSMARDLKTGRITSIKNFAIDLDFPARNFRALYSA